MLEQASCFFWKTYLFIYFTHNTFITLSVLAVGVKKEHKRPEGSIMFPDTEIKH